MDRYYSELTTLALNKAIAKIIDAQQYLSRSGSDCDKTTIARLSHTKSALQNRISEIVSEPKFEK